MFYAIVNAYVYREEIKNQWEFDSQPIANTKALKIRENMKKKV